MGFKVNDEVVCCRSRKEGVVLKNRIASSNVSEIYYIKVYDKPQYELEKNIRIKGSCDTCKDRLACLVNEGIIR